MPAVLKYLPPTDPERGTFSLAADTELQTRRALYKSALAYYNGPQPKPIVLTDEDIAAGVTDDNTEMNYVKMAGDRTVTFLFPEMPEFTLDPEDVKETPDEKWLREWYEDNGGLGFWAKTALRGFLAGHAFVRVKPGATEGENPTLVNLDPMSVTVYWEADDEGKVLWYEQRYYVGEQLHIKDFVRRKIGKKEVWRIITYAQPHKSTGMITTTAPTPYKYPNDFDNLYHFGPGWKRVGPELRHDFHIPPIIDFAHLPDPDNYYGVTEVTRSVRDLQDMINRIATQINQISRLYSEPKDVITGTDPQDVEDGGDLYTISSPAAKVTRLEMKSDLAGLIAVLDRHVETFLALLRVVLLKGGAKDLQRVTNTSVRTLFLDMLSKNNILVDNYRRALQRISMVALSMTNRWTDDMRVTVKFGSPLPVDLTEIANVNAIMVGMKARSLQTAAEAMGDDWSVEKAQTQAEATWTNELTADAMETTMQVANENTPDVGAGGRQIAQQRSRSGGNSPQEPE